MQLPFFAWIVLSLPLISRGKPVECWYGLLLIVHKIYLPFIFKTLKVKKKIQKKALFIFACVIFRWPRIGVYVKKECIFILKFVIDRLFVRGDVGFQIKKKKNFKLNSNSSSPSMWHVKKNERSNYIILISRIKSLIL